MPFRDPTAVIGTYTNAGVFCLPAGAGCIAHKLPTTPDFATWMPRATALATMPILVTADQTALVFSASAKAEGLSWAQFTHSLIS